MEVSAAFPMDYSQSHKKASITRILGAFRVMRDNTEEVSFNPVFESCGKGVRFYTVGNGKQLRCLSRMTYSDSCIKN